jgi:hypothetical protein
VPLDPVAVTAAVAANVHRPPDDELVARAVDAAIEYVAIETELAFTEPPTDLPDSPLVFSGMVGFAGRFYLDAYSPNGVTGAVGDDSFAPVFNPEDLYRHWHHYFDHLKIAWGVA